MGDLPSEKQTPPFTDLSSAKTCGETKWLRLETVNYVDEQGCARPWDRCVRTTKLDENSTDAVAIVATLTKNKKASSRVAKIDPEDEILMVKQFRPPINGYTIELPAGLIDKGETPGEAALRELKEECGYIGEIIETERPLCSLVMSPGMSNESAYLVHVHVDLNRVENQKPKQELGEGEFCKVLKVKKKDMLSEIERWSREDNAKPFQAVYTLAVGMAIGSA
eukprot:GEMP01062113.1.p1 GENE.GEMP01062113.1~~GEMP01062113.1.p1  ORF type:complete len:223 (+),score=52.42 GEMP01062113.1:114-782(+)